MQTFLPYPDFAMSASVLDVRRLIKQRLEAKWLLEGFEDPTKRVVNHPAFKMWVGFRDALVAYYNAMDAECEKRGYKVWGRRQVGDVVMPPWMGDEAFHRSHRSRLIQKDAAYYGMRFPGTPGDLPYEWPTLIHGDDGTETYVLEHKGAGKE